MNKIKKIPYGITDYALFKTDNLYYVDKTKYIELLEEMPNFLFLIRPRRFGKSLFINTLKAYYDVHYKNEFNFFFSDTYIGKNPTPNKNKYLILSFNFAIVDPRIENTEESFEFHFNTQISDFLSKYKKYYNREQLNEIDLANKALHKFVSILKSTKQNKLDLFIIIDEYDNFTNSILASYGEDKYLKFTKEKGFFKHFFNVIKAGTTEINASISKMFITGVSPITLEDVTSGGIGHNITTNPLLNEIIGFTKNDVNNILKYYKNTGKIKHDINSIFRIFKQWYGNYVFAKNYKSEMYNSTMVFNFLTYYFLTGEFPDNLVDDKTKIDYTKLRHLLIIDKKLNGNFSVLKQIVAEKEINCELQASFSIKELHKRDNFISLLYYFGLLTISEFKKGQYYFKIPNEAINSFFAKFIKDAYEDANIFNLDIYKYGNLINKMAFDGEWQPVFEFLSAEVKKQTKIRDYIEGESMLKGFLLAYLNIIDYFIITSEKELNKGFADLWLQAFWFKYSDIEYSYIIELKYFKRTANKNIKAKITDIVAGASQQLKEYEKDKLLNTTKANTKLIKIVLIYNAWELVHYQEV